MGFKILLYSEIIKDPVFGAERDSGTRKIIGTDLLRLRTLKKSEAICKKLGIRTSEVMLCLIWI